MADDAVCRCCATLPATSGERDRRCEPCQVDMHRHTWRPSPTSEQLDQQAHQRRLRDRPDRAAANPLRASW